MKFNLAGIMKNAWAIARHAKNVNGGKASEYFALSLKQSWAEAKARQAKNEAELKPVAKPSFSKDREVEDLTVTFLREGTRRDTFYGPVAEFTFADSKDNYYTWTTSLNGYAVRKLVAGKQFTISFNRKLNHGEFDGDINYVIVK